MGVVGMVNAAKNSRKLYEEIRSVGFEDDEFPVWWYSLAREQQEQLKEKREQPSAEVNGGEPSRGEQRVLDPVSPRRAVPIEDRRSRPNLDAQLSTPQLHYSSGHDYSRNHTTIHRCTAPTSRSTQHTTLRFDRRMGAHRQERRRKHSFHTCRSST